MATDHPTASRGILSCPLRGIVHFAAGYNVSPNGNATGRCISRCSLFAGELHYDRRAIKRRDEHSSIHHISRVYRFFTFEREKGRERERVGESFRSNLHFAKSVTTRLVNSHEKRFYILLRGVAIKCSIILQSSCNAGSTGRTDRYESPRETTAIIFMLISDNGNKIPPGRLKPRASILAVYARCTQCVRMQFRWVKLCLGWAR